MRGTGSHARRPSARRGSHSCVAERDTRHAVPCVAFHHTFDLPDHSYGRDVRPRRASSPNGVKGDL